MAGLYPHQPAIDHQGETISYQQLNQRAGGRAGQLRALDAGPVVGVLCQPGIDQVAWMLGIFQAGCVYLPLSEATHGNQLPAVLEFSGASALVSDAVTPAQLAALPGSVRVVVSPAEAVAYHRQVGAWLRQPLPDAPGGEPDQPVDGDDAAYIFFTSGSTSAPKAVLGNHKSLHHFIAWEQQEFAVGPQARVSQLTPLTFDASLRDMLLPLCSGGTLCIPPPEARHNAARLLQWLGQARVTLIHCVPSLFRVLLRELEQAPAGAAGLETVRHILMAGEPLYAKDVHAWRSLAGTHTELVNLYGATEATMAKTCHRIGEVPVQGGQGLHVGKPISNTFIALLNDRGELCRIGEIGEVYILTPYLTSGYLNNDELNRRAFVPNPLPEGKGQRMYRTGDLGRYLPDRNVEILGRLDSQVKVNGIRLDLADVREAVLGFAGVDACELVAEKNEEDQTELICYFTGRGVAADPLREHLSRCLTTAAVPGYFVQLDEMPLNINGKVNRRALPKPEKLTLVGKHYQEVVTAAERRMEGYWKQVLGLERIGRKAPFFKIGGNSLKAIQVISRVYREVGVLVKIKEMFAHNTVEALAAFVEKAKRQQYQAIPNAAPADSYDLSPAQRRVWISSESDPASAAYNISDAFWLEGTLDAEAFARALDTVVERHEILRTTFPLVEGTPRQRVHPAGAVAFHQADLRGAADADEQARQWLYHQATRPFDLQQGPLLRTALLRLDDKHLFSLVVHHIISDAWSMDVFTYEVLSLYNAYRLGRPSPLEALRIQYKDYAAWRNGKDDEGTLADARAFWHKQFAGELPLLELPLDFPRQAHTFEGAQVSFMLDPGLGKALADLNHRYDCSHFMLFHALLLTTIYGCTRQDDIVVGSPVVSRDHPDLENQIGFYVNVLPLRCAFTGGTSFGGLLQKVKKTSLESFEHDAYPVDQLLEELNLPAGRYRNPLFDFGYTYININAIPALQQQLTLDGIRVTRANDGFDLVKTDMWFKVVEHEGELGVELNYNRNLFREATASRFLDTLRRLAAAVAEDPSQSLDALLAGVKTRQLEASAEKQNQVRSRNLDLLKSIAG
jgi:amino acid adenylation domain-containing protein